MFIHILPNIGGDLLGALEKVVVNSGYYLADDTDGNESFVIGFLNSFTEDIPIEKRISIATPDMIVKKRRIKNIFCSRSLTSVQGKKIRLITFLKKQKKSIPLTVTC